MTKGQKKKQNAQKQQKYINGQGDLDLTKDTFEALHGVENEENEVDGGYIAIKTNGT